MHDTFQSYYQNNFWGNAESVSGAGSTLKATETIRTLLSGLLPVMGITSILDAACGDYGWFQHIKLPVNCLYTGMDIVPQLIYDLNQRYSDPPRVSFWEDNFVHASLPAVDMIFCRDALVHLPNRDIEKALKNFRASHSKWLIATTFPGANPNHDIKVGQWRPTDLTALRYGLGPAGMTLLEGATGEFANKSLGLWRL